jgi:hypothetical protein
MDSTFFFLLLCFTAAASQSVSGAPSDTYCGETKAHALSVQLALPTATIILAAPSGAHCAAQYSFEVLGGIDFTILRPPSSTSDSQNDADCQTMQLANFTLVSYAAATLELTAAAFVGRQRLQFALTRARCGKKLLPGKLCGRSASGDIAAVLIGLKELLSAGNGEPSPPSLQKSVFALQPVVLGFRPAKEEAGSLAGWMFACFNEVTSYVTVGSMTQLRSVSCLRNATLTATSGKEFQLRGDYGRDAVVVSVSAAACQLVVGDGGNFVAMVTATAGLALTVTQTEAYFRSFPSWDDASAAAFPLPYVIVDGKFLSFGQTGDNAFGVARMEYSSVMQRFTATYLNERQQQATALLTNVTLKPSNTTLCQRETATASSGRYIFFRVSYLPLAHLTMIDYVIGDRLGGSRCSGKIIGVARGGPAVTFVVDSHSGMCSMFLDRPTISIVFPSSWSASPTVSFSASERAEWGGRRWTFANIKICGLSPQPSSSRSYCGSALGALVVIQPNSMEVISRGEVCSLYDLQLFVADSVLVNTTTQGSTWCSYPVQIRSFSGGRFTVSVNGTIVVAAETSCTAPSIAARLGSSGSFCATAVSGAAVDSTTAGNTNTNRPQLDLRLDLELFGDTFNPSSSFVFVTFTAAAPATQSIIGAGSGSIDTTVGTASMLLTRLWMQGGFVLDSLSIGGGVNTTLPATLLLSGRHYRFGNLANVTLARSQCPGPVTDATFCGSSGRSQLSLERGRLVHRWLPASSAGAAVETCDFGQVTFVGPRGYFFVDPSVSPSGSSVWCSAAPPVNVTNITFATSLGTRFVSASLRNERVTLQEGPCASPISAEGYYCGVFAAQPVVAIFDVLGQSARLQVDASCTYVMRIASVSSPSGAMSFILGTRKLAPSCPVLKSIAFIGGAVRIGFAAGGVVTLSRTSCAPLPSNTQFCGVVAGPAGGPGVALVRAAISADGFLTFTTASSAIRTCDFRFNAFAFPITQSVSRVVFVPEGDTCAIFAPAVNLTGAGPSAVLSLSLSGGALRGALQRNACEFPTGRFCGQDKTSRLTWWMLEVSGNGSASPSQRRAVLYRGGRWGSSLPAAGPGYLAGADVRLLMEASTAIAVDLLGTSAAISLLALNTTSGTVRVEQSSKAAGPFFGAINVDLRREWCATTSSSPPTTTRRPTTRAPTTRAPRIVPITTPATSIKK